jgi:outer membrane immunogenic protein
MKKFLLASAAVVVVCGTPAFAETQSAPILNWSGFYVGANAGYGRGNSTWTDTFNGFFAELGDRFVTHPRGALAGAQFGYNWQNGRSIVGVEMYGARAWLNDQIVSPIFPTTDTEQTSLSAIWAATTRFGQAFDRTLFYLKAGYAGARIKINAHAGPPENAFFSAGKTAHGWTIGAGFEYALTPTWLLGLEYNYFDFGSTSHSGRHIDGIEDFAVRSTVQSVIARVNYRFGN